MDRCLLFISAVPRRSQQMEQERRDRELALRLAAEDQNQVEDVVPLTR